MLKDLLDSNTLTIEAYFAQLNTINYRFEKFERKKVANVNEDESEEDDDYIDPATYDTSFEEDCEDEL